jgi:hypothetical protein
MRRTLLCAAVLIAGCQRPAAIGQNTGALKGGNSDDQLQAAAEKAIDQPANPNWAEADDVIIAPIWRGNDDKGAVYAPLFRGATPGLEERVYTPPDGDCTHAPKGTVRVDWDKSTNTVSYTIKGKNFARRPTMIGTDGVDWWHNPWHDSPKDIVEGRYRLWTVIGSVTRTEKLYYDPTTLLLIGHEFSMPTPPADAITVALPSFSITGSSQFEPDVNGYVSHQYTVPYNQVTTEDGHFSRCWTVYGPEDLCQALPLQPAVSQLRPIASPYLPADQAATWPEILHGGLVFDLHVEPPADPNVMYGNFPYVFSAFSVVENLTYLQGGVPNGWHAKLMSAILNVAPNLEKVPNGGNSTSCKLYVNEAHVSAPRYCEMAH